jgi:hypothetical protein
MRVHLLHRTFWTAVAKQSGDTAFERKIAVGYSGISLRAKAAWRFASRRSPKGSGAVRTPRPRLEDSGRRD